MNEDQYVTYCIDFPNTNVYLDLDLLVGNSDTRTTIGRNTTVRGATPAIRIAPRFPPAPIMVWKNWARQWV